MTEEYLLAAMRLAAGSDPAPRSVLADARAAGRLRLPGAIVADPVEVPPPGGMRHGEGPRLRRFTADGLVVEVELTACDGQIELAGRVAPGAERVEVRTLYGAHVRVPSASGHFAVTGLPPGWLSVACHRAGAPPVTTRWLCVRD